MAAFLLLIEALETARNTLPGIGVTKVRNTKRNAVWTAMGSLEAYVQGLADQLTPDAAGALIESAGLLVAKAGSYTKPVLQAKLTTTPGLVRLIGNASVLKGKTSKKATFTWQSSLDGKVWTTVISTPLARTTVPSLTLMTTYWFRVSATVGETIGDWSQPVTLLVH